MAIELQNSMFIHIPKCGGRWVKDAIMNNVEGAKHIGDPVYDSHNSPDTDKPVFCVVREPATFAHSLWHHRARKKSNRRGAEFNWQDYIGLEEKCKSEDYLTFMNNVSEMEMGVWDYYQHYVSKYEDVHYITTENLAEELVEVLHRFEETFNEQGILKSSGKKIGVGPNVKTSVDEALRIKINNANKPFCKTFQYPTT